MTVKKSEEDIFLGYRMASIGFFKRVIMSKIFYGKEEVM